MSHIIRSNKRGGNVPPSQGQSNIDPEQDVSFQKIAGVSQKTYKVPNRQIAVEELPNSQKTVSNEQRFVMSKWNKMQLRDPNPDTFWC